MHIDKKAFERKGGRTLYVPAGTEETYRNLKGIKGKFKYIKPKKE